MGVGLAVGDDVVEEDAEELGVGVTLGEADGEVVVGLPVGDVEVEVEGEREGVAGAELPPCAGPTKLGPCTGW